MKVYFDLLFLLNFTFDFLLLMSTSYILKRNANFKRLFLSSTVGSLTTFLTFVDVGGFMLFLIKIIVSLVMIVIAFSFKNFKYFINNIIYLYLCSIILGGGLYLIKNEAKLNFLIIIIMGPIILYLYIMQTKKLKNNYNNYYKVDLIYEGKIFKFTAFLDTGNKLKDQYKKRPIILIHTDKIKLDYDNSILVPYSTVSGTGILKCVVVDKIIIDDEKIINKPLVGLANDKFQIDGIDMILNNETL